MNLVLLFDDDFTAAEQVRLRGRRAAHVLGVHRAVVGDTLRVGVLNGRVGSGRITHLVDGILEMAVVLDGNPPPPLPLTLCLALPRPKTLKKVLQAAVAMGVKRIFLMATWRVEKSFWESPALATDALHEQVLLGLEQGCDTVVPTIEMRRRFKPFIEDEVPALVAGTLPLAAHPLTDAACPRGVRNGVTLAVGPEGGFIPYEIDLLRAHGFTAISLGPRPLRVEHAVPALLSRLF